MAVTIKTPLLMGGVSTQPPHLRYPHQVEDAGNARFSVADGVSKRSGTWLLRNICTPALSGNDYRLHAIDRDGSEQYLVIYGPATIRVVPCGSGAEATVTPSGAATTYIGLNSATSDQLRLVTIADYTLILNTTVPVSTAAAATYTITTTWYDYDRMVAHTPADNTYHQTTHATPEHEAGFYRYTVGGVPTVGDTGTFATIRFATIAPGVYTAASATAGFWQDPASTSFGFFIAFRRQTLAATGCTWNQAAKTLTKTGAFATYTFAYGDHIRVTSGTNFTAGVNGDGFFRIASKTNADTIVLDTVTGHGTAAFTNDNTDTVIEGISAAYNLEMSYVPFLGCADMYEIAEVVQQLLRDEGAGDALVEWTSTGYQAGYFTITSPYRTTEATIYPPEHPTLYPSSYSLASPDQAFSLTGPTVTAGTGTGAVTLAVDSRWTKVPASGEASATIDATLMPHKMVRTVIGPPATFTIGAITWDSRFSGDDITNPVPSLWKKARKITDMAFFRQRLALCGGENIVMSETNNLFNYYLVNAPTVVDSDRIDVALSSDEVTLTDYMAPLQDSLQVFTQAGRQFDLSALQALSPTTVRIKASTAYKTLSVRPKSLGQYLYFLGKLSCAAQLEEYAYDDSTTSTSADDVSAHYADKLSDNIRTLAVSQNLNTVVVLPTGGHAVHVYQPFWDNGQKKQSAWTRYDFDESYTILDIAVIGDLMYMLVKRAGPYYTIEVAHIGDEGADCDIFPYTACGTGSGSGSGSGSGTGTGSGGPTEPDPGTIPGGLAGCATTGPCIEAMNCTDCPATSGGIALVSCYSLTVGYCGDLVGSKCVIGQSYGVCNARYCCYTGFTTFLDDDPSGCSAGNWCDGETDCFLPCTG